MHPNVRRAIEEIDAAIMSGDTFAAVTEDDERNHKQRAQAIRDRKEILEYLAAWWRELSAAPEGSPVPDLTPPFKDLIQAAGAMFTNADAGPQLHRAALRYAAVELERHPSSLELPGHAAVLHLKSKGGAL